MEDAHDSSSADATYRFISPLELPALEAGALAVLGAGDGVFFESGPKTRQFDRKPAAFLDDPDGAGVFKPQQVGSASYLYPPAFIAAVDHGRLIGYRTLLTTANRFFSDEAYAEEAVYQGYLRRLSRADNFSNEATGFIPEAEGVFRLAAADRPEIRITGNAVVLCSDEPLSYGSFLFRVVPKVLAVRKAGLTHLPCIAYAHQPAYRDLLMLAGVPEDRIILHDMHAITHIDRAVLPCLRNTHGYLDPESCELFAEMRRNYGDRAGGRRIYVSRHGHNQAGWSSRVMTNEQELMQRLVGFGFDIVEPERHTVREQIAIFASAAIVVGPSGSNMYNTMFCHPGTKVIDIQSEPQWIYSYTGMYASLDLDYGIFVGKPDAGDSATVHRRWSVNIDALMARIEAFLAS